jgi:acyl carrier protein
VLESIVGRVLEIPPDTVTDELGPAVEGGWTSLRHVLLVSAVQKAYGVKLTPREIRSIRTVRDLRAVLVAQGVSP